MPVRVLCLGNDLLADDAFGLLVARQLRAQLPGIEVVETMESGFRLLDYTLGAASLLVIDTVLTGKARPGTVHVLSEAEFASAPGGSPHYLGLFETLALGRRLGLPVPSEVVILAVEAADCLTIGGAIDPAVQAALPVVVDLARKLINGESVFTDQSGGV